jgi:hypothetical protein
MDGPVRLGAVEENAPAKLPIGRADHVRAMRAMQRAQDKIQCHLTVDRAQNIPMMFIYFRKMEEKFLRFQLIDCIINSYRKFPVFGKIFPVRRLTGNLPATHWNCSANGLQNPAESAEMA